MHARNWARHQPGQPPSRGRPAKARRCPVSTSVLRPASDGFARVIYAIEKRFICIGDIVLHAEASTVYVGRAWARLLSSAQCEGLGPCRSQQVNEREGGDAAQPM